jgi:hypothetical protein
MQLPASASAYATKQRVRTVTCRFHCDCGRHFASIESFDQHRRGSYRDNSRHCVPPEQVKNLVAKTEDGRCDIGYEHSVAGITVWQTRAAAEASGWDS